MDKTIVACKPCFPYQTRKSLACCPHAGMRPFAQHLPFTPEASALPRNVNVSHIDLLDVLLSSFLAKLEIPLGFHTAALSESVMGRLR
eukprot:5227346-Amphidinium_carterae.1